MSSQSSPPRLLYLYPGFVPPPTDERRNKHVHLSSVCEGDILLPVWWKDSSQIHEKLGIDPSAPFTAGKFRYHFFLAYRYPPIIRDIAKFFFYLREGGRLIRSQRYDAVVSYGTNATGIAASRLSRLAGAPLIVEIPGVPRKAYVYDVEGNAGLLRLRKKIADFLLGRVLRRTKHLRLLFPTQLEGYELARRIPATVFHEFVAVDAIAPVADTQERFVYFLGSPWHLKGVDTLIKAFRRIEKSFPDVKLVVVGHCADRTPYERLSEGSRQVELHAGKPHAEAMSLMQRCTVFVLPSRTEAMGCVALEAMAAARPVIASRVDGIPYYVEHDKNGLLFEPENVDELAQCLERILSDGALARRLGEEGRRRVKADYDERAYAARFGAMLEKVVGGAKS